VIGIAGAGAVAAAVSIVAAANSQAATTPAATCAAIYEVESEWPTGTGHGFEGDIQIVNLTASTLTQWTFGWTFPNDQKIYQSWGADFDQNGATVTAASEPNEGWLAGNGGRFHIGFLGTVGNTNALPTSFTFNGASCPLVNDDLQPVNAAGSPTPTPMTVTTTAAGAPATTRPATAATTAAPAPTTPTAAAPAAGTCKAIYEIETSWPTSTGRAFLGDVQIVNSSPNLLQTWSFTWTFPNDQKIYQSWGADFNQNGKAITANSEPNEGRINPNGGTFHMGFLATFSGVNAVPGNFTLNGTSCPLVEG
jgi:hypothetical protein